MGKNKNTVSPVKRGMNRNTAPYLLQGMEYLFALNSNIQDDDTTAINITNEESNILAVKFKEGFKVIGKKNDILSRGTYFFLVNPETEESEFGIVHNNQVEKPDILEDLEVPLEEVDQEPYQSYTTIINKGLNLDINHPVHKIVLKNEQCGKVIAFTDNLNPPRLIVLDKLEEFLIGDKEVDPEKIAIFKKSLLPQINVEALVTGGRLRRGTYQFLVAYTNKLGEEISEYTSITNPIPIFDKNDRILEQSELSDRTNYAIKLRLDRLDQTKDYYKIVVIQNTDIEGGVAFFEEGIHPISDTSVIYATDENKKRITLEAINKTFPYVKRWRGLTESKGHLIGYGIEAEKEINLQPVANLMGAFLKWQTSVAKESLYAEGEAVSNSKGYMRNESYPFGFRVKFNTGYTTALFPFVARPAEEHELETPEDNKDIQSIFKNNPDCSKSERTKVWQFYNTAEVEGQRDVTIDYTEITEPVTKTSYKESVGEVPASILHLKLRDPFTTLRAYIEDNLRPCGDYDTEHPLDFMCDIFDASKYDNTPVPSFEDCQTPIAISDGEITIAEIVNEQVTLIPKEIGDYRKFSVSTQANIYEIDIQGEYVRPLDDITEKGEAIGAITGYKPFVRNRVFSNTDCSYTDTLTKTTITPSTSYNTLTNYFNNIDLYNTKDEAVIDNIATASTHDIIVHASRVSFGGGNSTKKELTGHFYNRIHKNALWFNVDFNQDDFLYLEVTKEVPSEKYIEAGSTSSLLRVTTYNDCDTSPVTTKIVKTTDGGFIKLDKADYPNESVVIAIDTPIVQVDGKHLLTSTRGLYGLVVRPEEFASANVKFDKIILDKKQSWRASCRFKLPNVDKCEIAPYQYGKFGYVESLENYPDNEELYDSSKLRVDLKKIPESIKADFKKYYIKDNPDGSYELNDNANFINKPIRHYKFPDNDVAPFISKNKQAAFSDSIIFPIGVHIDDEVVSAFLDVAVDNGLLTQEQRDSIIAYEIFRGDRTLEKSIEAKGLLYDNYQVKEENEDVYFPNFPFNTLGKNPLLYEQETKGGFIDHPFDSEGNNSFQFISPDNQYRKLSNPTELQLEGYQFGNSKSYFADVEDHPKWVILGDKAYRLANKLAIAETVAEIVIKVAEASIEASKNLWFEGGFVIGGNPAGAILGWGAVGAIALFQGVVDSIFKVARYRYQWLTTFRDLGQPENFAAYSTGLGDYNSLRSIPAKGNILRGINTIKDFNSGRFSFRHQDSGKKIVFNNQDRESSTYLYLGEDFNLNYPAEYREYDNQNTNFNYASRTFASQEGACTTGQSKEIIGNIASPYVSLKNYIPSQYGTVDSIKWLPTSYISYFDENQDTIFGGDIFISRMTMKRKFPMFIRDAMGGASLQPFNYSFYNNVGYNRFYCNYEVTEETNLEDSFFPDHSSEYNFDCQEGERGFYVKPPSKFYLYYYGIVNFLVESEINSNFRYGKKDYKDNFYPNVGDIVEWTQEKNVSIKDRERFFYNFAYSLSGTTVNNRTLPFTYSKEEYDCRYDSPNGAMWSLADNSEKDLSEPWLIYRPYDTHNFPASLGGLVDLRGIESGVILGRFKNQTAIFNRVDTRVEGISPELGTGMMFQRMQTFTETDLGYMGSQNVDMVSSEYGHFFVDAERGQVFKVQPSGGGVEEISKLAGNNPTGMDKWFKKHLPFKVFNPMVHNYEDINIDNAYNGLGITMGWDSKNDRVFLTKKDYIPLQEMNYENGNFFAVKDEFELITDYEADGYTYEGKEGLYYKFSKATVNIPQTAKIFVVVNVDSFSIEEGREIKDEIKQWADEIGNEVVFISTKSDRLLSIPYEIVNKSVSFYNQGVWNTFSTYQFQDVKEEAVIINFTNSSAYVEQEPSDLFITDYKLFMSAFNAMDYFKNIIVSKDEVIQTHVKKILNASDEYKDVAIKGTSPQKFIEPLRTYGISYVPNFDMNSEKLLNEVLGDEFSNDTILVKGDVISVTDTEYFKDVSWTIAYQADTGSWLSYYSFEPNYYVGHNTYFQSGVNNQEGKDGLWSHNMSNKSYGVFYGEKQPWIIEYPIKNEYVTKRLQNVTFWTEAKRYINEYDFAYDRNITFDQAVIYNSHENSGLLNLIPQKTLSQITKYPITREGSQDILITNQDYNWTFNNIYNRTLNQEGVTSAWITDENQIHKTINNDLVRFGGKKILSYLRGDYFIVRLTQYKSSEHNIVFKWATNQEEVY